MGWTRDGTYAALAINSNPILRDPGAVSRAGRKCATKVYKHGRKSRWVPTLTEPFPNGQANAGSWLGTKNGLYYLLSSFREFVHDGYYLATFSRFVHQAFLIRNEGTTDESKNVWMLPAGAIQFALRKLCSDGSQCIVNKQRRRESKKKQ